MKNLNSKSTQRTPNARNQAHVSKSQVPSSSKNKHNIDNRCQSMCDQEDKSPFRYQKKTESHQSYLDASLSQDPGFYQNAQPYQKRRNNKDIGEDVFQKTSQFYKYENLQMNSENVLTILEKLKEIMDAQGASEDQNDDPFQAESAIIMLEAEEWSQIKDLAKQALSEFNGFQSSWSDFCDDLMKNLTETESKLKKMRKRFAQMEHKSSSRLYSTQKTMQSAMEDSLKIMTDVVQTQLTEKQQSLQRESIMKQKERKQRLHQRQQADQVQLADFELKDFIQDSSRRHARNEILLQKTTTRGEQLSHRSRKIDKYNQNSHRSGRQSARLEQQEQLHSSRRNQNEEELKRGPEDDYLTNPVFLNCVSYQPAQFDGGLEQDFDGADQTLDDRTFHLQAFPDEYAKLMQIKDPDQRVIFKQLLFMKHEKEFKMRRQNDKSKKRAYKRNQAQQPASGLGGTTPRDVAVSNNKVGTDSDATQIYQVPKETPSRKIPDGTNSVNISGFMLESPLSSLRTIELQNLQYEQKQDADLSAIMQAPEAEIPIKTMSDKGMLNELLQALPNQVKEDRKWAWSSEEGSSGGSGNRGAIHVVENQEIVESSPNDAGFESSSSASAYNMVKPEEQRKQKDPPNIVVPRLNLSDSNQGLQQKVQQIPPFQRNDQQQPNQIQQQKNRQRDLDTIQERFSEFQSSQNTTQMKLSAQKNEQYSIISSRERRPFYSARGVCKMEEQSSARDNLVGLDIIGSQAPNSYRQHNFNSNKFFRSIQEEEESSSLLAEMEAGYLLNKDNPTPPDQIFEKSCIQNEDPRTASQKKKNMQLYEEEKTPFKLNDDHLYQTNLHKFNQIVSGNVTNSLAVLGEQIQGIHNQTYENSGVQFGMMSGNSQSSAFFNQLRFRSNIQKNSSLNNNQGPWSRGGEPTCKRGDVHRDGLTLTSFSDDDAPQQLTRRTQMMMHNFHNNFYYNQQVGVLFTTHVTEGMNEEFLRQCITATYKPQIFKNSRQGPSGSGIPTDKNITRSSRITQHFYPSSQSQENSAMRSDAVGKISQNTEGMPAINLMKARFVDKEETQSPRKNNYQTFIQSKIMGEKPNTVINRSRIRNFNLMKKKQGQNPVKVSGLKSAATSFINDESLEINDL